MRDERKSDVILLFLPVLLVFFFYLLEVYLTNSTQWTNTFNKTMHFLFLQVLIMMIMITIFIMIIKVHDFQGLILGC